MADAACAEREDHRTAGTHDNENDAECSKLKRDSAILGLHELQQEGEEEQTDLGSSSSQVNDS